MHHKAYKFTPVLLAVTFILVACGGESGGDGYYTRAELEVAVKEQFPKYDWPANFEISADDIISDFQFPAGSRFEPPYEYMVTSGYHTCAWEITLIKAVRNSNQELVDQSMHQLMEAETSEYLLSLDEIGQNSKQEKYNSAVLGDPADLQSWVNNNCGKVMPYFDTRVSNTRSHTSISKRSFAGGR